MVNAQTHLRQFDPGSPRVMRMEEGRGKAVGIGSLGGRCLSMGFMSSALYKQGSFERSWP